MAIGGIGLALLDPTTPTWILSALLVPIGLTGPLVMPPTTAVLLNSVPTRRAGTASGVFNTGRRVSGALAITVFGSLLSAPAGFQHGLQISLVITAATAIITAATAALLSARRPEKSWDGPPSRRRCTHVRRRNCAAGLGRNAAHLPSGRIRKARTRDP